MDNGQLKSELNKNLLTSKLGNDIMTLTSKLVRKVVAYYE